MNGDQEKKEEYKQNQTRGNELRQQHKRWKGGNFFL